MFASKPGRALRLRSGDLVVTDANNSGEMNVKFFPANRVGEKETPVCADYCA